MTQHDFKECQRDPVDCGTRLERFWTQISARYGGRFPELVFELLNEPGGRMTAAMWNETLAALLPVIGATNPTRTVVVPMLNSDDPDDIGRLALPEGDTEIIVAVHYYKPMEFTHQGASWSKKYRHLRGVTWGTQDEMRQVALDFAAFRQNADRLKRPVYLGEFGAYEAAGLPARARYAAAIARAAEAQGKFMRAGPSGGSAG